MRVQPRQLDNRLRKGLEPVYFLYGSEPLELFEAADRIRAMAREQGFSERLVFEFDNRNDWSGFFAAAQSMSLFGDRQLLDVRLNMERPDDGTRKALMEYLDRPSPDHLVLITAPRLDGGVRNSKWFKRVEAEAVLVQFWPVQRGELPGWIRQRAAGLGLRPDPQALGLLAERADGNLLAAAQELEKLLLLHGKGDITVEQVAEATGDSARYSVFDLGDAALGADRRKLVRMLRGMQAEGVAAVQVLWWLAADIRTLAAAEGARDCGAPVADQWQKHRLREKRKPLFNKVLRQSPPGLWGGLLRRCAHLDRVNKGLAAGNAWDELLELGLLMGSGRGAAAGTPEYKGQE